MRFKFAAALSVRVCPAKHLHAWLRLHTHRARLQMTRRAASSSAWFRDPAVRSVRPPDMHAGDDVGGAFGHSHVDVSSHHLHPSPPYVRPPPHAPPLLPKDLPPARHPRLSRLPLLRLHRYVRAPFRPHSPALATDSPFLPSHPLRRWTCSRDEHRRPTIHASHDPPPIRTAYFGTSSPDVRLNKKRRQTLMRETN